MASERIFTDEQQEMLAELARRRGFTAISEYLLRLAEVDAQEHGEALPFADNVGENFEDPVESFRKAWGEAMRGEGMTEEEFERRMLEDAN